MVETGMIPGSGTQGRAPGQEKVVEVFSAGRETVSTKHSSKHGDMYVVRLANANEKVVLQVDTGRLEQRNKIKAANDSVRRRTRG